MVADPPRGRARGRPGRREVLLERGAVSLEELDAEQLESRKSMIDTDGLRHAALRRLLQRDFTPRSLEGYESFLRGLTATTLDAALAWASSTS